MLKGRLVLGLEDPRSIVAFGLRTTILEGAPREIPEVLAGLDSVTADDVARVAKDLLAPDKLRMAAIGPFDDEKRFEALARPSRAPRRASAGRPRRPLRALPAGRPASVRTPRQPKPSASFTKSRELISVPMRGTSMRSIESRISP